MSITWFGLRMVAAASVAASLLVGPISAIQLLDRGNATSPDRTTDQALERYWGELAENDAEKAFRAIGAMASTPTATILFLKSRLQPVPDNSKHLEMLIRGLDSNSFTVRDKAIAELKLIMSDVVANALKLEMAKNPGLETRRRIEQLLDSIPEPNRSPAQVRFSRALEVLEWIGTKESQEILESLGKGNPVAATTLMAREANARLAVRLRPAPALPAAKVDAFGDPLPAGVLMRLGTVRLQNADYAAFTPDGKTLITIADNRLDAWDTKTGRAMQGFPQVRDWTHAKALAISPDGKLLAVAHDAAYSFDICELPSGKLLHRHQGGGDLIDCIYSIAFTTDSKTLVIVNQDSAFRWDVTTGKKLSEFRGQGRNLCLAVVAPNGKLLATAGGTILYLWDAETGKLRHKFKEQGHIADVACSRDGARVAAASESGTKVRVWDAVSGELLRVIFREGNLSKGDPTPSLAFAPGGRTLAITDSVGPGSSEIRILIYDLEDKNAQPRTVRPPHGVGWLRGFSPDGQTLLYQIGNSICLLETDSGKDRHAWHYRGGVTAVAYSHDGSRIAAGSDDGVVSLYDATNAKLIRVLPAHQRKVNSIEFSPDGKWIITCGGYTEPALLWDVATGVKKAELDSQRNTPAPGGRFATFSLDSKHVTVAGYNINHASFLTATGKLDREFPVQNDSTWSMAFSSDRRYIASGVNSVYLHDRAAMKTSRILDVNGQCVASAFSRDSRTIAAVNTSGQVFLWEIMNGGSRARFDFPPKTYLWSGQMTFSPDNRLLAAVGHSLHSPAPQIWDLATRTKLGPLPGHINSITAVAFSPDCCHLATASKDGTVLVRNAPR
jgi:WD40 repeat protein